MGLTKSQQFIKDNAYRLESAADYFNVDSALMRKENYENSTLKMLLILPTPALQKSVSATVSVINSSFHDTHEGMFLDVAYLPPKKDQELFDERGIPYCIGHITHLDASHFDIIGFSISVLHEIMTIPVVIKSFERCDKPIPLTWTERKKCKIGDQPFVIAGGITAVNSDICFGALEDGTARVGYLDGLILGQDDVLEDIFPLILDSREKGHTIEQGIERWFTSLHFYHPYAYRITYRDNLIVENVKIHPKARDLVKPRYDKTIKKRLYSARTVVSATGANAGATQIMLSEGCTGGNGNCRFCAEGHYTGSWVENPIENVKWAAREAKRYSAASSVKPMSFNALAASTILPTVEGGLIRLDQLNNDKHLFSPRGSSEFSRTPVSYYKEFICLHLGEGWFPMMSIDHRQVVVTADGTLIVKKASQLIESDMILQKVGLLKEFVNFNSINDVNYKVNEYVTDISQVDISSKTITELLVFAVQTLNKYKGEGYVLSKTNAEIITQVFYLAGIRAAVSLTDNGTIDLIVHSIPDGFDVLGLTVIPNEGPDLNHFEDPSDELKGLLAAGHTLTRIIKVEKVEEERAFSDILNTLDHLYHTAWGLTHNCNHYSDYSELLFELKKEYPVVTFINMRLEELAQDTESWDMMSYLGASRLSAPVEGLSDRVRNNLMNKNLSLESVETLFDYMIGQGISDLKVGLVFTGYEEDRDWDEITEQMKRLKKKAELLGKKLPIRFKACLHEDNLTPIPGVGLVKQNEFQIGRVYGLGIDTVLEVIPGHVQEAFKVELSDGTILVGNGEHPLLTNPENPQDGNNFTFFKDLKPGKMVFSKIGSNAYGLLPVQVGNVSLTNDDILKIAAYLNDLEKGVVLNPNDNNITLLTEVFNLGTGYDFPDLILKGTEQQQKLFAKAYLGYSVIGSLSGNQTLVLAGTQITLYKFKMLLANIGIHSILLDDDSGEFIGKKLAIHRDYLWILKQQLSLEAEAFDRILRFEPALEAPRANKELISLTVKSVTPVGEKTVYGLTVANGLYLTDFVVSHNTPLVQYPLTAFEYIERKATKLSYEGKRFISDERYLKNREAGIQVRFNGFTHSTFIEQSLVDLGSSITWWLHKHLVQNMELAYDLRVVAATDERMQSFKDLITCHDKFFGERDMDNYISPTHRIRLDVEGGTFVSARAILKGKDPEPTGKCLYTYNGCSTSCSFKDIRDNPYIRYTDCVIDENGKISGKIYSKIEGCQYCETPKERVDHHLKRKLSKKYSMKDITSEVYARALTKYRVVIERQFAYKEVNPNNTAYTAIAAMLNHHEPLLEAYWEIDKHSFDHQTEPDIPFAAYGMQVIDVLFKHNVDHHMDAGIREANKWLQASQIVSVTPIPLEEKMRLTNFNVFRFETNIPLEKVLTANKTYKKTVKVVKDMEVVEVEDKTLITPAVTSYGKTIGYFTLPVKYNPYLYLQTLLKDTRLSFSSLKAEIMIKSVLFTAESKSAVCSCGQPTLISLVNNKALKCPTCLTKALLIVEMNKAKKARELETVNV